MSVVGPAVTPDHFQYMNQNVGGGEQLKDYGIVLLVMIRKIEVVLAIASALIVWAFQDD